MRTCIAILSLFLFVSQTGVLQARTYQKEQPSIDPADVALLSILGGLSYLGGAIVGGFAGAALTIAITENDPERPTNGGEFIIGAFIGSILVGGPIASSGLVYALGGKDPIPNKEHGFEGSFGFALLGSYVGILAGGLTTLSAQQILGRTSTFGNIVAVTMGTLVLGLCTTGGFYLGGEHTWDNGQEEEEWDAFFIAPPSFSFTRDKQGNLTPVAMFQGTF